MGQSPLCHQLSNMLRRGSVLHARSLLLYRYGRRSENNGGKQETAAIDKRAADGIVRPQSAAPWPQLDHWYVRQGEPIGRYAQLHCARSVDFHLCCYLHCFPALTPNPLPSPPPLRLLKRTLEKASQFPIRGRIFFTSEHTVSRRKDASRWRRRAWDAHHFAKEERSSHPQTRRALQALVCLQRSCFAASSAFREVPKKKGVVSLKRGNSFF